MNKEMWMNKLLNNKLVKAYMGHISSVQEKYGLPEINAKRVRDAMVLTSKYRVVK